MDVSHFQDLTIQVAGTFSATVVIEGSVDGTNWSTAAMDFSLASSFTAVGFSRYIAPSPVFLRVNITAWVSGTPTVQVSGGKR